MSSQDTLKYAEDEEARASDIQNQIQREQADINALQKDINSKADVITGLQSNYQQHMNDAQRLREKAIQEQRQEQEEQMREQRDREESFKEKVAKESVSRGLFG